MAIKLNIGDPNTKKTLQIELDDQNSAGLHSKKIGESFKGELIDKPGYEFQITGGSDKAGFPMRNDVEGEGRKKILITTGIGNRKRRKGMRLRRTVAGNTISDTTVQVNVKILKQGKAPLVEVAKPEGDDAPKEEAKPAEKKDAPQEKPKEEPPKEDKPEEKKEAPKEEAKPEEKKDDKPKKEKPKDKPSPKKE